MKHSGPMKTIAWLPIAITAGLIASAQASAGPFNGSQNQRVDARSDIILVDDRRHGSRARHRKPHRRVVAVPAHRRYRNVYIDRRHGHRYRGYGPYRHDVDAHHWLAFTAITVKLLDMITVSQQRAHESAQIRATAAPIGETVRWNQDGARGAVTAVRDGRSSSGRYCREFQQTLVVGGKTENAYGTACRQPDGSWELIP